ncbi:MAG: phosphatidate cytidylyltransferase, partial [Deltaproteobacteria bacterium]|nr:phosphatidate cytidylyltransferase [Deltaproteobacteria bacterium]
AAAIILAFLEYNNLTAPAVRDRHLETLALAASAAIPAVFFLSGPEDCLALLFAAVAAFFLRGMLSGRAFRDFLVDASLKTFGLAYIAVPLSYMILVKDTELGGARLLFFFIVIWSSDTFAYITGKAFGRHKFAPVLSPGKTIEGVFGGLAGSLVAAAVFNRFMNTGFALPEALAMAFLLAWAGIAGDLAESLIKRAAGAKDSGTIMPGHGGMLDRIDSLLFPLPIYYYMLRLV